MKRVLAIVPDLLIETRIEGAAKGLNAIVETASVQAASELIASTHPELAILDLAAPGLDLDAVVASARAAGVQLAAFYPHVDAARRRAAKDAGIEHLYPRSRFLRDLPKILIERLHE